jgi:Uma2 family endonuclease
LAGGEREVSRDRAGEWADIDTGAELGSLADTLSNVATLVRDPPPAEFLELLERRRRLGHDLLDEVWQGVRHVSPAPHQAHALIAQQLAVLLDGPSRKAGLVPMVSIFNLGEPDDYRVPDGGILRPGPTHVYAPSAALVVEIVSPGDETWEKLPFYASRRVDEVLIISPQERSVHWLGLGDGAYAPIDRSRVLDLGPGELAERLEWPDHCS